MLSCLLIPSWSDSPFPSEEWEVNKFCGYFLPFVIEFCNGRPLSWLVHSNVRVGLLVVGRGVLNID